MDERDLGALLSEPGLSDVMAALRAAPAPAELDREAAARAAYRMFLGPDGGRQALAHGKARHRRPRRLSRPVTVLLSGAAAVAGIVVLVLTLGGAGGTGTPGQQPRDTHSVSRPGGGTGQQAVEGKASATPTAQRPTPAASSPSAAPAAPAARSRCHQSFAFRHDCAPAPGSGGGFGSSGGFGGFGGYSGRAGRGQR